MMTVKAKQKLFTYSEVSHLTGICAAHLHNFAKRHHLGFVAHSADASGSQAYQRLFTPWDLNVLAILCPRCIH
jgi:hypothetical protein